MSEASRDENFVPTLLAVSSVDGVTPVPVYANPVTHRLLVDLSGGGSGDVVGPASSTDNAIARFDGTTGKVIQDYTSNAPTISDDGQLTIGEPTVFTEDENTPIQVAGTINDYLQIYHQNKSNGDTASCDYIAANDADDAGVAGHFIDMGIVSSTSSATPTINTDNVDFYSLTAQTANITSFTTNLSGTPTDGQTLRIAITGTAARTITWGASFEASTIALPVTTVLTNRLDVEFIWNTVTSKWRCISAV
jgi:hypothetical protein